MKVLLVNGSPRKEGNTYLALREVANTLEAQGVETEIFWLGNEPINGCIMCGGCRKTGRCTLDDIVTEFQTLAQEADGFVFGSPVHYASAGGAITSLMDRMFYCGSRVMRTKPGCAIVSARRAGTTATLDQLNKYFIISGMPIVPSQYWPMVHGNTPEQVAQDEEGLQIMRQLGRNMAWMVKSFALAKEHGIEPPKPESPRKWTNFVR